MAWERDKKAKAPCWLCGLPIDYLAKPGTTGDSWEPDHDPPVSKAPEYELDLNHIKPAHSRCNRIRGGAEILDIGQRSRDW